MPNMTPEQYRAHQARMAVIEAKHECTTGSCLPPRVVRDIKEHAIQTEIEGYLRCLGSECWFVRCRMSERTTYTRVGIPDFIVVYRGKAYCIEVKMKGKKASGEQQAELYHARSAGATTAVVTTLEEVVKLLQQ